MKQPIKNIMIRNVNVRENGPGSFEKMMQGIIIELIRLYKKETGNDAILKPGNYSYSFVIWLIDAMNDFGWFNIHSFPEDFIV
jgi:hypothetical protein